MLGGIVTVVPDHFEIVIGAFPGTRLVKLIKPEVVRQVGLIWVEGNPMLPMARAMLDAVRDLIIPELMPATPHKASRPRHAALASAWPPRRIPLIGPASWSRPSTAMADVCADALARMIVQSLRGSASVANDSRRKLPHSPSSFDTRSTVHRLHRKQRPGEVDEDVSAEGGENAVYRNALSSKPSYAHRRDARPRLLTLLVAACCIAGVGTAWISEEVKDYGKPGSPIDLVMGYQPYYTESWSGVIMRSKKFYEKYLPAGSKVDFQIGLQGAIIVNGMLAGKVDLGYVGDMPGIVSTSHADVRDIRMVSVLGLGYDQCNAFLVRTDAPQFQSSDEAIAWLNGKTVAVPKGSCTDRFAQAVFKRFKIAPSEYLNQSIEVITSGFRAKKLDAAVMWEPTTSRLVLDKLARKIATGASVNENDGGFMVMPQSPDRSASRYREGMAGGRAGCAALFRRREECDGGKRNGARANDRIYAESAVVLGLWHLSQVGRRDHEPIVLPYTFTPEAKELIGKAAKFLLEIKSIKADIRPEAVMPGIHRGDPQEAQPQGASGRGEGAARLRLHGLMNAAPPVSCATVAASITELQLTAAAVDPVPRGRA